MKFHLKAVLAVVAGVVTVGAVCAQTPASGPSDPQIVGIVEVANKIDINYAKLAMSRSHNTAVRAFAQDMEKDHTAVLKSVEGLAAKLKVKPMGSETKTSLSKQATEELAHLKTLHGTAFDKAYIDNEVNYHKAVIGAVNTVLIPNAKNAELKSAIEGVVPMFQGHLEHAEQVQADLK